MTKKVNLLDISTLKSSIQNHGFSHENYTINKEHGSGSYNLYTIEGLYIFVFDFTFNTNTCIDGVLEVPILELSFLLEGEQTIDIKDIEKTFLYEKQESYLVYLPKIDGAVHYSANKPVKEIKIRMDESFLAKHNILTEAHLLNIHSIAKKEFIQPINSNKQEILIKILNNNLKGLCKRLFLESQVIQLLSIQINQSSKSSKPDNLLKKIYNAESIIANNLTQHHSITELSKIVGINELILKKEFKRVFQLNLFEYLSKLRMQKAKDFLQHSDKPIYEIAESVGYKNATHFSAAFKKKENITPKNYRIHHPNLSK